MAARDAERVTAVHLDAVGGLAGDMFAAAVLDARSDLWPACDAALKVIGLPDGVSAGAEAAADAGFAGTRFRVDEPKPSHGRDHDHVHWSDIRERLETADLAAGVRRAALGIFEILAEAEAAVHGIAVDRVAFHEVGAIDSLVDVVVAAALIDGLGEAAWSVGPLPRGRGQVKSQHGILPVPAPATAEILKGFVLVDDGEDGERITPTGAAILKYLNPAQTPDPTPRVLLGAGMGFGTRKLKARANLLRATLFGAAEAAAAGDAVEVLRCEIDDQTGEDLAVAVERLRATEGVLDVCQWPVFGKKGRVATALQVLASPPRADAIVVEILNQTETLGVRRMPQVRSVVDRREVVVDGVRVKLAARPGGLTAKAEMDDAAAAGTARERLALKRRIEAQAIRLADDDAR